MHWECDDAIAVDIKVDPQRRRLATASPTVHTLIEGLAANSELVRVVWHSNGGHVEKDAAQGDYYSPICRGYEHLPQ